MPTAAAPLAALPHRRGPAAGHRTSGASRLARLARDDQLQLRGGARLALELGHRRDATAGGDGARRPRARCTDGRAHAVGACRPAPRRSSTTRTSSRAGLVDDLELAHRGQAARTARRAAAAAPRPRRRRAPGKHRACPPCGRRSRSGGGTAGRPGSGRATRSRGRRARSGSAAASGSRRFVTRTLAPGACRAAPAGRPRRRSRSRTGPRRSRARAGARACSSAITGASVVE